MATKKAAAKKPMTGNQAKAVANFLKSAKGGTAKGAPAQPTAAQSPVSDDDDDDMSQGA